MSSSIAETVKTESETAGQQVTVTDDCEQVCNQTKRELEFSSENNKLEISNLPPHMRFHLVKHLVEKHFKLNPHKIKVGDRKAYLAFLTAQERDDAIARIDNQEWKGRMLEARPAEPRQDPFIKKQRTRARAENSETERATSDAETITDDAINSQVCPLWSKTYEEQIKFKDSQMRSILNMTKQITKLSPNLKRDAPKLHEWVQKNSKICCPFDGVVPSPLQSGYRNKCEFNVGRDGTVGFRMGRYKDGLERVVQPPSNCPILRKVMFDIIQIFQTYLKNSDQTRLKGFDQLTHEGNVRQLTIRANEQDECLIIVDMHPQNLADTELNAEIDTITNLFKPIKQVVSIFFNISDKNHLINAEKTIKLVYGQSHLYEHLAIDQNDPLKFRIGPTSFFQVNTKAAELLYRSIIEIAQLSPKSLVLDVGCGTGTISLSLARQVSYVIGIEIVESAIEDAKINAQENNISNVSFFAGKAEELINESIYILRGKLAEQNNEGDIVAIVDPPRVGFNTSFVKSLRASNIQKIIYVACDPKANTNLISLCRPSSKAYQGRPFVPTRAKAFDLFPHTKFCELVLVYERLKDNPDAESLP